MNRNESGRFTSNKTRDIPEKEQGKPLSDLEKEFDGVEFMVYSKLLQKPFNNIAELRAAEDEFNKAHEAELKLKEERASRAKEVEEAYKHSMNVRKEAQKMIKEADDAYYDLRSKFIDDYHSYHISYSNNNGDEAVTVSDLIDSFFKNTFWF